MKPRQVDFIECLKDSPSFRASLEDAEQDLDQLEMKLEKLMKLSNGMIEAGKAFSAANSQFMIGLRDVASNFSDMDGQFVSEAIGRFSRMLTELQKYHNILLDHAHQSIVKTLTSFVKHDIRRVKEARRQFEKISNDMDSALVRNSQPLPRGKMQEAEEVASGLATTRVSFTKISLEYIYQINIVQSKKKFEILDAVLAYIRAQQTYFRHGNDLFVDNEKYVSEVTAQSVMLSKHATEEREQMEKRHVSVQLPKDGSPIASPILSSVNTCINSDGSTCVEGYLFKRTSNTFKTWVRRWFMLVNNQLVYRKRSKDVLTVMEDDLRLCTVRPSNDLDRRFCLEVLSPARSHMLQADSEADCQAWMLAIQSAVTDAYHSRDRTGTAVTDTTLPRMTPALSNNQSFSTDRSSPYLSDTHRRINAGGDRLGGEGVIQSPTTPGTPSSSRANPLLRPPGSSSTLTRNRRTTVVKSARSDRSGASILSVPGNSRCADCCQTEPAWASINLGITLCIECSGIHRSFGVHTSKVRGIALDAWEPDLLRMMAELGNAVVNNIYEANVDETIARRATPQSTRTEREAWIRAKYVTKSFVVPMPSYSSLSSSPSPSKSSSAPSSGVPITSGPDTPSSQRWSVCKRKRQSDSGKLGGGLQDSSSSESSVSLSTGAEASSNASPSNTARRGDVIVFGADVNSTQTLERHVIPAEDSSSGNSIPSEDVTDDNEDVDTASAGSMTSLEDLSALNAQLLLYKAARARNLRVMLEAMACGANVNWINDADSGRTPLIQAVRSGTMTTVEFLLLNGAKVDIADSHGQTPLHHATTLGHTGQVCQLLKKKANRDAVDDLGQDPLSIAVQNANADIVTMLRLAKLNEEMSTDNGYSAQGEDSVNDVFRDYANISTERHNRSQF